MKKSLQVVSLLQLCCSFAGAAVAPGRRPADDASHLVGAAPVRAADPRAPDAVMDVWEAGRFDRFRGANAPVRAGRDNPMPVQPRPARNHYVDALRDGGRLPAIAEDAVEKHREKWDDFDSKLIRQKFFTFLDQYIAKSQEDQATDGDLRSLASEILEYGNSPAR